MQKDTCTIRCAVSPRCGCRSLSPLDKQAAQWTVCDRKAAVARPWRVPKDTHFRCVPLQEVCGCRQEDIPSSRLLWTCLEVQAWA